MPLTVDTYDIFAFETRIREMVDEQMKPVFAITKQDHQKVDDYTLSIERCTSRLT